MQLLHNRLHNIASFRITSLVALSILIVSILFPVSSFASSDIVDVSDNDCAGVGSSQVKSSIGHYDTGIVSVSGGGADWAKNSCLHNELQHFNRYALYVATNYPSHGCPTLPNRTLAFLCGFNLGFFDVRYASSQGAHSNAWFVDVEINSGIQWSSHSLDSSFLYGLQTALVARGVTFIGYYSTAPAWQTITGGWHNEKYAWYATGALGTPSSSTIKEDCRSNFTGGPVVYYQYIIGGYINGIDHNKPC
jgi:hypothetical protein